MQIYLISDYYSNVRVQCRESVWWLESSDYCKEGQSNLTFLNAICTYIIDELVKQRSDPKVIFNLTVSRLRSVCATKVTNPEFRWLVFQEGKTHRFDYLRLNKLGVLVQPAAWKRTRMFCLVRKMWRLHLYSMWLLRQNLRGLTDEWSLYLCHKCVAIVPPI